MKQLKMKKILKYIACCMIWSLYFVTFILSGWMQTSPNGIYPENFPWKRIMFVSLFRRKNTNGWSTLNGLGRERLNAMANVSADGTVPVSWTSITALWYISSRYNPPEMLNQHSAGSKGHKRWNCKCLWCTFT